MFDINLIWEYWPIILQGLPITLKLTLLATLIGMVFGFLIAIVKINRVPVLRQIGSVYVSFIRGVPLMVLLYMTYYGLPLVTMAINSRWGTNIDINKVTPFTFALVAFVLQESAYQSEVIRAALLSVDRKDIEAAKSIGMTSWQTLRRITIPQALVVAVPSFGNAFTSLLKGTSLAFTIAVMDMMGRAKVLGGRNFHYFEAYTCAALTYWIICIILGFLVRLAEKKLNYYDKPANDECLQEGSV